MSQEQSMSQERLGIGDRPVKRGEPDQLGIGSYAKALQEFIAECDTPLTIGIQGDWGSGKTSLMNLIRPAEDDPKQSAVLINTWKYAQLGESETLFLAVLSGVVEGISGKIAEDKATPIKDKALKLLGVGLRMAARVSVQAVGGDPSQVADSVENTPGHKLADELKKALEALVAAATAPPKERVILFVDDLDRIPPVRAVQILEALKNFLDVPNLVTVLACDYAVISKGLASRVGVSEEDLGRSFFDKIIQVPFRMPTHAYRADQYVSNLLERVGVPVSPAELSLVTDVLRNSVGLNPRALKRHANTLMLLLKVAKHDPRLASVINKDRRPLIMLALTAMEATFPKMHRYLARRLDADEASDEVRALVQKSELPDPTTAPWVTEYQESTDSDGNTAVDQRLSNFLEAFRNLIDVNSDKHIDNKELGILRQMIHLSSVSSVASTSRKASPRRKTRWTKDEFIAAVDQSNADPQKRDLTKRLLNLAEQLAAEGLIWLDWGKGVAAGSCSLKVGKGNLAQVMSSPDIQLNAGRWPRTHSRPRYLELARSIDALVGTDTHHSLSEDKEVYPTILDALASRDPELTRFENWLREAIASVDL